MFANVRKTRYRVRKGGEAGRNGLQAKRKESDWDSDCLAYLIGSRGQGAFAAGPGRQTASDGGGTASLGVQARLEAGPSEDPLEKEADRAADQVVDSDARTSAAPVQLKSGDGEKEDEKPQAKALTREETEKEKKRLLEEEEKKRRLEARSEAAGKKGPKKIQEKPETSPSGGAAPGSASLPARLSAARGAGSPMDAATREGMEAHFGRDLGGVRIHTDSRAQDMSRELGAQAFTLGKDVYFNAAKYNPATREGKRLLAHELTHVLQQNRVEEKEPAQRSGPDTDIRSLAPKDRDTGSAG
jgi:hypothetical protein